MSDESANQPLVDLSSLRLMPSWVANFGNESQRRSDRDDESQREDDSRRPRRGDRDRGGDRNDRGGRRPFGGGGGGAGAPGRDRDRGGRPFGGGGPRGDRDRRGDGPRGPRRDGDNRRGGGFEQRDERPQLPVGVKVMIDAEERALDALAQHIKTQGRAFSMFDAARLVLAGNERHQVKFECEPERLVGLFQVTGDGALFETREEAMRHGLRSPEVLSHFYDVAEVEFEEPKGNFNSVAVCGFSGEILGPTSHHSYQAVLKRIHAERFNNMSLEEYKRRVQVKSEPELVAQWKESQRKGTKWTWLRGEVAEGVEPVSFTNRAEMEAHFRRSHGEEVASEVRAAAVHGTVRREQLSPGLGRLFRRTLEETRKHLFELSQRIAQGLERRGLKLFKRRGGKLFVSRIKPRAIDPNVVFSERLTRIVERIKQEPGVQAAKLLEELAPSVNAPATADGSQAADAPTAEGQAPAAAVKELSEDQKNVIRDLRWLADEGYVIEYSDGPVFLGIQGDPPNSKPVMVRVTPAIGVSSEASASESSESDDESPEAEADAEADVESSAETAPAAVDAEDSVATAADDSVGTGDGESSTQV